MMGKKRPDVLEARYRLSPKQQAYASSLIDSQEYEESTPIIIGVKFFKGKPDHWAQSRGRSLKNQELALAIVRLWRLTTETLKQKHSSHFLDLTDLADFIHMFTDQILSIQNVQIGLIVLSVCSEILGNCSQPKTLWDSILPRNILAFSSAVLNKIPSKLTNFHHEAAQAVLLQCLCGNAFYVMDNYSFRENTTQRHIESFTKCLSLLSKHPFQKQTYKNIFRHLIKLCSLLVILREANLRPVNLNRFLELNQRVFRESNEPIQQLSDQTRHSVENYHSSLLLLLKSDSSYQKVFLQILELTLCYNLNTNSSKLHFQFLLLSFDKMETYFEQELLELLTKVGESSTIDEHLEFTIEQLLNSRSFNFLLRNCRKICRLGRLTDRLSDLLLEQLLQLQCSSNKTEDPQVINFIVSHYLKKKQQIVREEFLEHVFIPSVHLLQESTIHFLHQIYNQNLTNFLDQLVCTYVSTCLRNNTALDNIVSDARITTSECYCVYLRVGIGQLLDIPPERALTQKLFVSQTRLKWLPSIRIEQYFKKLEELALSQLRNGTLFVTSDHKQLFNLFAISFTSIELGALPAKMTLFSTLSSLVIPSLDFFANLVRSFKNKLSVFLYLQALVQQTETGLESSEIQERLSELTRSMLHCNYLRIRSFSRNSVWVLMRLASTTSFSVIEQIIHLLLNWSGFLQDYDLNNICYCFSNTFLKQLNAELEDYSIAEKLDEPPSLIKTASRMSIATTSTADYMTRVKNILQAIVSIVTADVKPYEFYLSPAFNQFQIQIQNQTQVKFKFEAFYNSTAKEPLILSREDSQYQVEIFPDSAQIRDDNGTIITAITFQNSQTKYRSQIPLFEALLDSKGAKLVWDNKRSIELILPTKRQGRWILTMTPQIIPSRFRCLSRMKHQDGFREFHFMRSINQHINVGSNGVTVLYASLAQTQFQSLLTRFDYGHFYLLLVELMRQHSSKQEHYFLNKIALQMIVKVFHQAALTNNCSSHERDTLAHQAVKAYGYFIEQFTNWKSEGNHSSDYGAIQIDLKPVINLSQLWKTFNKQMMSKIRRRNSYEGVQNGPEGITKDLRNIAELTWANPKLMAHLDFKSCQDAIKQSYKALQEFQYRIQIENSSLCFVQTFIFLITSGPCSEKKKELFELIKFILLNHEQTPYLEAKLLLLFRSKNYTGFPTELFESFLVQIAASFQQTQNNKFQERMLAKSMLLNMSSVKQMFSLCQTSIQIAFLEQLLSFEEDPELVSNRLRECLSSIDNSELAVPLLSLSKQISFSKLQKGMETNPQSYVHRLICLQALIRLWVGMQEESERKQVVKIVLLVFCESPPTLTHDLLVSAEFIRFLVSLTCQENLGSPSSLEETTINQCLSLAVNLPKKNILQFLLVYRIESNYRQRPLLRLLATCQPTQIKLYALSAILQYTYQCLCEVKISDPLVQSEVLTYCYLVTKLQVSQDNMRQVCQYCNPSVELKNDIFFELQDHLSKIEKQPLPRELYGGVFFKLILIVCRLLPFCNERNKLEKILKRLTFLPEIEMRSNKATFRAISDFSQVRNVNKARNPYMEIVFASRDYYVTYMKAYDLPIRSQKRPQNSILESQRQQKSNLTSFFADFLLMRLVMILQRQTLQPEIASSTSQILLTVLRDSPLICQDSQERQEHYLYGCRTLEHLWDIRNGKALSPTPEYDDKGGQPTTPEASDERLEAGLKFADQLAFISKGASAGKQAANKKKRGLLKQLEDNAGRLSQCKDFSRYFRKQAFSLLLVDLLHQFYSVVSRKSYLQGLKPQTNVERPSVLSELQTTKPDYPAPKGEVRMIYPYTVDKRPILRIDEKGLPNNTYPITRQTADRKYKLRDISLMEKMINNDQLNSFLGTSFIQTPGDEAQPIQGTPTKRGNDSQESTVRRQTQFSSSKNLFGQTAEKEKTKANLCELILREGSYLCWWSLTQKSIELITEPGKSRQLIDKYPELIYGTPVCSVLCHPTQTIFIELAEVQQIFFRKVNQILSNSIELFLKDGRSKLLTFFTESLCRSFMRRLNSIRPGFRVVDDAAKEFDNEQWTDKWAEGEISNFDYLMLVNKYAGRSYQDINQYYVFPWVLKDYSSKELNLRDAVYRNLELPIGAQNPKKLDYFMEKMERDESSPIRFLYGSHYSTSLYVYYYLVRIEPFSSLHREMLGGSWDHPDRMFISVKAVWDNLMNESATSDVKQCIPEFYYLPCFLRNINNLDLGQRQSGRLVGQVVLPQWAKNPDDFVAKMRAALQRYDKYYNSLSDYVTEKLNCWIDLIFGKNQYSLQHSNVFHPLSYHDRTNIKLIPPAAIEATMCQINFFGQNPIVLFKKEHRSRKLATPRLRNPSIGLSYTLPPSLLLYSVIRNAKRQCTLQLIDSSQGSRRETRQYCYISFDPYDADQLKDLGRNLKLRDSVRNNASGQLIQQPETAPWCIYVRGNQIFYFSKGVSEERLIGGIDLNFTYEHSTLNEFAVACWGRDGLRVYNWQCQIIFERSGLEVYKCYMDSYCLIYCTSSGNIECYCFSNGQRKNIDSLFQTTKYYKCLRISMQVFPEARKQIDTITYLLVCGVNYMTLRVFPFSLSMA